MFNVLAKSAEHVFERVDMKARQTPLMERYTEDPAAAIVVDYARTSSADVEATHPLRTAVTFCDRNPVNIPVGVHEKVGGDSDNPTPGDILCGAIAACLDSTIRIISNRFGVRLKRLEIEVRGTVDVRGTLRVDKATPVAFQRFDIAVRIKPAGFIPGKMLDKLLEGAERSCIVVQTVKGTAEVRIRRV